MSSTSAAALPYVMVTPARNEAGHIGRTIECMCAQTALPLRWVIVSDGSTDGTDDIVRRHAQAHPWIELVRMPERAERHFAGKVHAFNAGQDRLRGLGYEVIGNLDADISFEPGYFEFILGRLAADPRLGVAGTPFREGSHQYDYRFTNIEHVSGACQLFRRACFEEIGGYEPVRSGGIDWVAVTTARMKGWRTRTFCEMSCEHHRPMGTAQASLLRARFRQGRKDYALGGHPLWQLLRAAWQMKSAPFVTGGLALLAGYAWGGLSRTPRSATPELMRFHRREQLERLRRLLAPRRGGGLPTERPR